MVKPTPQASLDDALKIHRQAIDAIDSALLRLLNERATHAQEIGRIKDKQPAYRPEREAQVLHRLLAENPGPLGNEAVAHLYQQVMSACRALEQRLRVAYLGPAGTFSESAVLRHFGAFVDAQPCVSLDEVVRSVEKGQNQYAVVPIENSTEGAVGRTHDLMLDTTLQICAEAKLRIQQNLISQAHSLDAIRTVYSHPQSLAQCAQWLAQHLPGVECTPVGSNAEAARLAAAAKDAAAIAGENAAALYQLNILAPHIEDMPNNTTRFWVLGKQSTNPSGHDMTSLVMSAPNKPGAVYRLLEPLVQHGVSMTRLESRPARTGLWEYFFFVDLEGHRDDPAVSAALDGLGQIAPFLKILGSYPTAVL
ncbi:MAG: prephenate dehydratase [Proteobacteria bacterium]|nr:prephenate dehydratase [Pseudomonadota bacterium]MCL2306993.1 prephenate dehydratase [Pseudomonadota bacterium]